MKVSEITISDVASYLRIDDFNPESNLESAHLKAILTASKNFIADYTGIPISSTDADAEILDDHEDFYIVVMVLCQDMYDNRSMYVDKSNINRVVETILGMHCRNLL